MSTTTSTNHIGQTVTIDTPCQFRTGEVIDQRALTIPTHDGFEVVWVESSMTEVLIRWNDGEESWSTVGGWVNPR